MIKRILLSSFITISIIILCEEVLFAHSFSVRYNPPIDLSFIVILIVSLAIFSFGIISKVSTTDSIRSDYPRYNILQLRIIRTFFNNNILLNSLKSLSIGVLMIILLTSFFGTQNPSENLSPTMVWVIWWIGMGLVSTFVGNVWGLINPWKTIYEWTELVLGKTKTQRNNGIWAYPEVLDVWPAVIFLLILAWLENVFTGSMKPLFLGFSILIYSAVTWAGMIAFGKNVWLKKCDPFSQTFELLSCFSPIEFVESLKNPRTAYFDESHDNKALFLRPLCVGLTDLKRPSYAMMFFIVVFSSNIIYPGILETPFWLAIKSYWIGVIQTLTGVSIYSSLPGYVIDSIGMLLFWRVLFAVYSGVIHFIKFFSGTKMQSLELKLRFIWIVLPLAISFNFAHGVVFFILDGQMIISLISDPFGVGWDLFRTGDYTRNLLIIDAKGAFFLLIGCISIGVLCSIFVANSITNQIIESRRSHFISKLPLLIFNMGFVILSLIIISQPMLI